MYVCHNVCVYVYMYVCMYVCVCVYICMYMYVCTGIFLSEGARGALPPLNFDNPKRSKIWYVACGTIILNAKCESSAIDSLDIF